MSYVHTPSKMRGVWTKIVHTPPIHTHPVDTTSVDKICPQGWALWVGCGQAVVGKIRSGVEQIIFEWCFCRCIK